MEGMKLEERICPVMSGPANFGGTNSLCIFHCQLEKCNKFASCMMEEVFALLDLGLNRESEELMEMIKARIGE